MVRETHFLSLLNGFILYPQLLCISWYFIDFLIYWPAPEGRLLREGTSLFPMPGITDKWCYMLVGRI